MPKYVVSLLQGVVRRRRDAGERLAVRLPAAALRQPLAHDDRLRDGGRQGEGVLRRGREPDGRLHARRACTARACASSTGWWCATSRSPRPPSSGAPRRRSRAARSGPRTSRRRCSSSRPPRTPRRTARSRTRSAACSGTTGPSSRPATAAATSGSRTTSAGASSGSTPRRPARTPSAIRALTWDYPTRGTIEEPDAEAVLREVNGFTVADGRPVPGFKELADDGSTACGCWIYSGCYKDGVNQPARRKPQSEQHWVAPEWGWAWPANRRILYNRASADPEGRPWSERKRYVWWDAERAAWTGYDVPDFIADRPPVVPAAARRARDRHPRRRRSVHHAGRRQGLALRAVRPPRRAAPDPLRAGGVGHREPALRAAVQPGADGVAPARQPVPPRRSATRASRTSLTTYRLTEHHTAGGMSRWLSWLSELQPEMFCEVSPGARGGEGLVNGRLGDHHHRARGDRGAGARDRSG